MARITIDSGVKAKVVYPALGSNKSMSAKFVNFDLTDDEAATLGMKLIQGAHQSKKLTIRVDRKKNKAGTHQVTVTSDVKDMNY